MRLPSPGPLWDEPPEDDAARLAHWFEWVWHQGKADAIDQMFPEHGVAHGLGEPLVGPKAFREFQADFLGAFGTPRFEFHELFQVEDRVVLHATIHVTDRGNELALPGMAICRMEDGMIAEAWNYFPFLPVLMNRGIVKPADLEDLFSPPGRERPSVD